MSNAALLLMDFQAGPARFLPTLTPGEGELVVAKNRFSAFWGNDLGSLLRARSVT